MHCSFCDKSREQVEKLIASPKPPHSYICDECVRVCQQILEDERRSGAKQHDESSLLDWVSSRVLGRRNLQL